MASRTSHASKHIAVPEEESTGHRVAVPCTGQSYFALKGAAVIVPQHEDSVCPRYSTGVGGGGEIQQHVLAMLHLLRPCDTLKMAVRLLSRLGNSTRYLTIISTRGSQNNIESAILGVDYCSNEKATIGLVLPVWTSTKIYLDGDGGIGVASDNAQHVFKPVSLKAMWSAFQSLHRENAIATSYPYFPGGVSHEWVAHYYQTINSPDGCLVEWHNTSLEDDDLKADSLQQYVEKPPERKAAEMQIKSVLKNIMQSVDLDEVTSKDIRQKLEACIKMNLSDYRDTIDQEMLVILGQLDKPSQIFPHLYLGTEWNASNWDELRQNNVTYILNVTKEVDNFFPGMYNYLKIRVSDEESTELIKYWDLTYKFISKAKHSNCAVLVHCKKGISRSSSTVIAYVMKAYEWPLDVALAYVKEKRNCITPNRGFMRQLGVYQGILEANRHRNSGLWNLKTPVEGNDTGTLHAAGSCSDSLTDSPSVAEFTEKVSDVSSVRMPDVIAPSDNIILKSCVSELPCSSTNNALSPNAKNCASVLTRCHRKCFEESFSSCLLTFQCQCSSDICKCEPNDVNCDGTDTSHSCLRNFTSTCQESVNPQCRCVILSEERPAVFYNCPTSVQTRLKNLQYRLKQGFCEVDEVKLKDMQQILVKSGSNPAMSSGYDTSSISSTEGLSSDDSEVDLRRRESKVSSAESMTDSAIADVEIKFDYSTSAPTCSGNKADFMHQVVSREDVGAQGPIRMTKSAIELNTHKSEQLRRTYGSTAAINASKLNRPVSLAVVEEGQITPGQVKRLQQKLESHTSYTRHQSFPTCLPNFNNDSDDEINDQNNSSRIEREKELVTLRLQKRVQVSCEQKSLDKNEARRPNSVDRKQQGSPKDLQSGLKRGRRSNTLLDKFRTFTRDKEAPVLPPKQPVFKSTTKWYHLVGENLKPVNNKQKVSKSEPVQKDFAKAEVHTSSHKQPAAFDARDFNDDMRFNTAASVRELRSQLKVAPPGIGKVKRQKEAIEKRAELRNTVARSPSMADEPIQERAQPQSKATLSVTMNNGQVADKQWVKSLVEVFEPCCGSTKLADYVTQPCGCPHADSYPSRNTEHAVGSVLLRRVASLQGSTVKLKQGERSRSLTRGNM